MFADLNRYAIRPATSIGVLYDHRDPMAELSRRSSLRTPFLATSPTWRPATSLSDHASSSRSRHCIHANASLLEGIKEDSFEERVELAVQLLGRSSQSSSRLAAGLPTEVTAGEVRRDFIHTHSIVLHALGRVGNALLRQSQDPATLGQAA